jgi:hypothetical protein
MRWTIPYDDTDYEFDDGRFTASEARLQKRLTDGMNVVQAETARNGLDPDAWIAALVVARRRTGMTADVAADIDLDAFELVKIAEATKRSVQKQLDDLGAAVNEAVTDEELVTP